MFSAFSSLRRPTVVAVCSVFLCISGCTFNSANDDSTAMTKAAFAGKTAAVLPLAATLPPTVAETSGLVCLDNGQFLTINDSGHSATVYQLDFQGQLLQQYDIAADNRDWEAITIHQGQLWLADIGNNKGSRNGGDLYQLPLPLRSGKALTSTKFDFVYPEFPLLPLKAYQHDFDAEALVSANGQLFLFNKAWLQPHSTVYRLDPAKSASAIYPIATIDGLPGVITDAAFSELHQRFVVSGYARFRDNTLRLAFYDDYQPFLAVLDQQFKLQLVVPIGPGGQLEGICIDAEQQIWLTQEQSKRRPPLLWRWGTMTQLFSHKPIDEKSSQIN